MKDLQVEDYLAFIAEQTKKAPTYISTTPNEWQSRNGNLFRFADLMIGIGRPHVTNYSIEIPHDLRQNPAIWSTNAYRTREVATSQGPLWLRDERRRRPHITLPIDLMLGEGPEMPPIFSFQPFRAVNVYGTDVTPFEQHMAMTLLELMAKDYGVVRPIPFQGTKDPYKFA